MLFGRKVLKQFAERLAERQNLSEFAGKIVSDGVLDGGERCRPLENVLGERRHDVEKRIEREEHAGRDGETEDVDLGTGQIGGGGAKGPKMSGAFVDAVGEKLEAAGDQSLF